MLGLGSERFSWVKNGSLFGLYSPAEAIQRAQVDLMSPFWIFKYAPEGHISGLSAMSNCLILLLIGTAFYWFGLRVFEKRDLPAPM